MQITVYDENRRPETPDLRTLDAFDASFCTEHYVFHFRSGSCAAREIEQIAAEQERCFRTIEETLRIPFTHQIQYFFADSPEENGRILEELFCMYAPGNGFAVGPNNVFAVCNDQIKCIGAHEDTHLISYAFCDPACEFLSEGLAMLMDGQWWGEPNAEWVKRFLQDGRYCSVLAPRLSGTDLQAEAAAERKARTRIRNAARSGRARVFGLDRRIEIKPPAGGFLIQGKNAIPYPRSSI